MLNGHTSNPPAYPTATAGFNRAMRKKLAAALRDDPENAALQNLQGVVYLGQEDNDAAAEAFRRAVSADPGNPEFQSNLGTTLLRLGDRDGAIPALEAAIEQKPDARAVRLALTKAHIERGTLDDALVHAQALRARDPNDHVAEHLHAVVHLERKDFDTAARLMDTVVAQDLENADAWHNLGTALMGKGAYEDAAKCFAAARIVSPDGLESGLMLAQAQMRLDADAAAIDTLFDVITKHRTNGVDARVARLLEDLGRSDLGVALYERLLRLDMSDTLSINHLAAHLVTTGRSSEAIEFLEICLVHDPQSSRALTTLGTIFHDQSALTRAEGFFRRATQCPDPVPDAYFRLSLVLRDLHRREDALEALRAYIDLAPTEVAGHVNYAFTLSELNRTEEALDAFETVLSLDPDRESAQMHALYLKRAIFDWGDSILAHDKITDIGLGTQTASTFPALFLEDCPERQHARAKVWAGLHYTDAPAPMINLKSAQDKIKIGYFSADFFNFAGMHLMIGMLESHDRDAFEVSAFAYGAIPKDGMHDRIVAAVDNYYDVDGVASSRVAAGCREMGLDIALHRNGYTRGHRTDIFAHRAAPVQVNYLGYPSTLGAPFMDYIVGDPMVIPPQERAHYSESVIYMPWSYQPNDGTRQTPEPDGTRADHGLPQDAIVLCCFNNSFKIEPAVFDIWCRVMRRHENTVLWLLSSGRTAEQNLRAEAAARGVSADRIVFAQRMPHGRHIARQRHADLFVDTFAYNAHTTASDALLAGVPVVTMAGRQFAARVGASLLRAAGFDELITDNTADYEAKIDSLISDRPALAALSEKVRTNTPQSMLFDTAGYTRTLETAFHKAAERSRKGLAPADIHLK